MSDLDLPNLGSVSSTPFDASIPLGGQTKTSPLDVRGGASPTIGVPAGGNPLEMVQSFANTQGQLNVNKLFAQTYGARQKAGQILALSKDLPSAVQALQKDPQVGAFLPDLLSTMTGAANTWQSYKGQVQVQTQDAFGHLGPVLVGGAVNPASVMPNFEAMLNNIPDPGVRQTVAESGGLIIKSLTDGLPSDPASASAEYTKRLMASGIATGSLDAINKMVAQPSTVTVGGATVPAVTGAPIPNAFSTLSPGQIKTVGGTGTEGAAGPGGSAPSEPTSLAGDGKPLFPSEEDMRSPVLLKGVGGVAGLSAPQQTAANGLMTEWTGPGLRSFNNVQSTMGLLEEMDRDYDTMAKGGGFQVPGTAADARTSFAKLVNTLYGMAGDKPPFDPLKVGAAEEFVKDTRRMGLTVLTTMLGNQREAAQTISNITEAVPSIDNTYLGGKILIGGIRALSQRALDQRNFENRWQQLNQGILTGADEKFNQLHPMQSYIDPVLDSFGIDKTGFKSPADLEKAVQGGYLSQEQAAGIAKQQWPKGYPGPGEQ